MSEGGEVLQAIRRWSGHALLLTTVLVPSTHILLAQEAMRKPKIRVEPAYPALAQRMRIAGAVKIEVTIAPNGAVTQKKLIGGNPLLAGPCMDVLSKWKFEPGDREDKQVVEFQFGSK